MKKLLIVGASIAALTAVTAFAQSNVTIGGEVRMFEENSKTGSGPSVTRMVSGQSHIGFKASEDLKNGLTARVNIDTFITANTSAASSFGDYQSTIGLSSKLGAVDLGRKKSVLNTTADAADPFGTNYGSTFTTVHNLQTTRLNNGVFVETAEFAGFKGAYNFGQSNTAGVAATTGVGASYKAFGGEVHYAYQGEKATRAKTNLVGVSYTLPVLATKLGFDSSTSYAGTAGAARVRGNSFAVSGPIVANLEGRGTYGQTRTDGVADKTKALSLGVAYSLSKRTGVEVAYTNVNAPGVAADVRTIGAGLTHSF
jgi:predicted porin